MFDEATIFSADSKAIELSFEHKNIDKLGDLMGIHTASRQIHKAAFLSKANPFLGC